MLMVQIMIREVCVPAVNQMTKMNGFSGIVGSLYAMVNWCGVLNLWCSKLKRHVCELPWLSLVALGCPAVSIKKHLVVRCTERSGGKALTKEDLDSYQSAIDLRVAGFTGDDLN